ncbi:MAG: hypothetical protein ABS45_13750 [Comamonas sp. SCN 65-56]|uniref:MAPEG family protein n=1 Tax=Comamonas sp. SCN 65-56 TaxID=1660095 RepID=UPI00086C3093|nr:MAPEG family protein [Comamonas sp. SCN 65-56]ODS90730.1 MAG: hypothetical protein ABS45_13750 [Comamonas sp. SCN 65-56]
MNPIHIVALLALLLYLAFTVLVGRQRMRGRVVAPATTGDPAFERAFRVQQNTLEQLVVFLPALFLAGQYWSPNVIAGIGVVWLVGRVLYRFEYTKDPASRTAGFILTLLPTVVLVLAALWGVATRG